jgi:hypothetical protein
MFHPEPTLRFDREQVKNLLIEEANLKVQLANIPRDIEYLRL